MKKLILIWFALCSVALGQPMPLMRDPLAVHKDDLVHNVKDPHGGAGGGYLLRYFTIFRLPQELRSIHIRYILRITHLIADSVPC